MTNRLNLSKIDVVDAINPAHFKKEYLQKRKPVILKNYAENWAAVNKWTIPFFQDNYGNMHAKMHGKWQDHNFSAIQMPYVKESVFSEFLNMLQNNETGAYKLFLFDLIQQAPELRNDFTFTPLVKKYVTKHPLLFFGLSGSDVRLHFDIDLSNIFLTQFLGTKRITLFDPSQTPNLYKIPFTTHSAVDIKNPDFEKFPRLKDAIGYQCDLKPGETLFMPCGMWHHMDYLDGSFSLSLRSLSSDYRMMTKGFYNFFVLRHFDRWMHHFYDQKWTQYKLKKTMNP